MKRVLNELFILPTQSFFRLVFRLCLETGGFVGRITEKPKWNRDACRGIFFASLFILVALARTFAASPAETRTDDTWVEVIPPPAGNSADPNDPELTILGVFPETVADEIAVRPQSRLIRIPAASVADEPPRLLENSAFNRSDSANLSAAVSENPTESPAMISPDRAFVCRLNHLSEKEQALLDDAQDGRWDALSFLEAVLIAEGTSESEQVGSMRIFSRLTDELDPLLISVEDETEKARIVFEFLHRRVLTGPYDLNRSSTAVSLATGLYNCVSATVLFNALAEHAGLSTRGLETTGHAKSRLVFADSTLDVETTCTHWDLLPDKPVARSATVTLARPVGNGPSVPSPAAEQADSAVPNADDLTNATVSSRVRYRKRPVREVSPVEFVATIYYNKGVDFYQEKKFGPAIAAYLKATALDPGNRTVEGNLKATLNNLAIELAMRKNFAEAIRLTEQGLAIDPSFDQFRVNLPLYYRHWSEQLRRSGDLREADRIERLASEQYPTD